MTFILLWKKNKKKIIKLNNEQQCKLKGSSVVWTPNFFKIFLFVFCKKKEIHIGLEQHEDEYFFVVVDNFNLFEHFVACSQVI